MKILQKLFVILLFATIAEINGKKKGFNFLTSTIIQDSFVLQQNQLPEYFNGKAEMFQPSTPQAYFNLELELLKELPPDILVILKIEKLNTNKNVYEPTPVAIEKKYCAYMKMDKIIYPIILRKSNFPTNCPVVPGQYFIHNFTVTPEDIPMSIPSGTYKLFLAFNYQNKKIEFVWKGRST